MIGLSVRAGDERDEAALLALFDQAVEWLVARGQSGQWGAVPFSAEERGRRVVHELAAGGGLHVAELAREVVGALVVGDRPAYVPPPAASELYVRLVITSRPLAGNRIGSVLIAKAREIAADGRVSLLRVDCWAGAPALVEWYEREGFRRSETFDRNGWKGQVLEMPLPL